MVLHNTTELFTTISQTGSTQCLRMVLHNTTEWFYTIPKNGSTQYHWMVPLNITEWFYSIQVSLNGSTQYHWMVLHNMYSLAGYKQAYTVRVCSVQFALFVFANIVMKTTIRLEFTDDSRCFHTKSLHILSCGFAMIGRITNTVCKDNINPNSWTNKYTVFQMQQIPTFICK